MASAIDGTYQNPNGMTLTVSNGNDSNGTATAQVNVVINGQSYNISMDVRYHFQNSTGPNTGIYMSGAHINGSTSIFLGLGGTSVAQAYSTLNLSGGLGVVLPDGTFYATVIGGPWIRQ